MLEFQEEASADKHFAIQTVPVFVGRHGKRQDGTVMRYASLGIEVKIGTATREQNNSSRVGAQHAVGIAQPMNNPALSRAPV
jgi:hypothetical protein